MQTKQAPKYSAFISYSHDVDGDRAARLQHALHNIAKPWYRIRSMRVFRDETNVTPSAELWQDLLAALQQSQHFILFACPESAQSIWVGREVKWWLEHRSARDLLIVKTGGQIAWGDATHD